MGYVKYISHKTGPIHQAAGKGDLEELKGFVAQDPASVNALDGGEEKKTASMLLLSLSPASMVEAGSLVFTAALRYLLLSVSFILFLCLHTERRHVLAYAAGHGQREICQYLLDHGSWLNYQHRNILDITAIS